MRPFTAHQIATWVVFALNILIQAGVTVPLVKEVFTTRWIDKQALLTPAYFIMMNLIVLFFAYRATITDPSDELVK
jgi:hypothetical protein